MKHLQPARYSLALAAMMTLNCAAVADEPPRRPPTPTPPPQSVVADIDRVRPGAHQGLLREGSRLLQAQGHFAHDPEVNAWKFTVKPSREDGPVHVLMALPTSFLSEAQQVALGSPEHQLLFEVSGEVTVYKGRNYLLLTQPPRVVGHAGPATPGDDDRTTAVNAEPHATERTEQPQRDAESIMRELEQQAGPVQRRVPTTRGSVRDGSERIGAANNDELRREGSNIVMRRGRISRDSSGAWLFVFDADASGTADPPMTLMPCLLLQRLERHYQTRGNAPLLLSGRVFTYEGRNHLLPTVFTLPRERDVLMP